jgi:hypothetical protein
MSAKMLKEIKEYTEGQVAGGGGDIATASTSPWNLKMESFF